MATPLAIRPFRGRQPGGGEFGRLSHTSSTSSSRSHGVTSAYLGSSPSASPSTSPQQPFLTLGLHSDASAQDIKKAYRRLALQFHPDVCKGESCTVKFMQINDAYEAVMGFLEGNGDGVQQYCAEPMAPEPMMGAYDESWDEWEEWMGWEGAGIRDYSTHVNHSL